MVDNERARDLRTTQCTCTYDPFVTRKTDRRDDRKFPYAPVELIPGDQRERSRGHFSPAATGERGARRLKMSRNAAYGRRLRVLSRRRISS